MTVRWILATLTALATASVVAALAFVLSPSAPGLSSLVFGICALPVGGALGWVVCVAPASAPPQLTENDIETRWLDSALSGTATDLVIVIGLGLTAVSISRTDVPASSLLIALLIVAFTSCTVRYVLERRRTLSS